LAATAKKVAQYLDGMAERARVKQAKEEAPVPEPAEQVPEPEQAEGVKDLMGIPGPGCGLVCSQPSREGGCRWLAAALALNPVMDRGTGDAEHSPGADPGFNLHELRGPNLHEGHQRPSVESPNRLKARGGDTTDSRRAEPEYPPRPGVPLERRASF
jgi:hypothetical protein